MAVPPANIAAIIDKTAGYVVKNGSLFEDRLKKNSGNDQFQFLDELNQYYGYYQQKLASLRNEENHPSVQDSDVQNTAVADPAKAAVSLPIKVRSLDFLTRWDLTPSAYDLLVMKLTAMYVARNGDEYGPALYEHEKTEGNGAQFAFMDSGHSLHPNYKKYIDTYRSAIEYMEGNNVGVDELVDSTEMQLVIQRGYLRAMYRKQNRQAKQETEEKERERKLNFASIDWQDFLFVARVEFDAIDQVKELAVPLTRDSLVHRSLEAKAKEVSPESISEKIVETSEEPENNHKETTPQPKVFKGMKVRAAGESRLKKKTSTKESTITCPLTGKQIPALQFESHIQTLLRDPRYKEQQDNYIRKNFSHASNITTDQVYENIVRLTKKRRPEEDDVSGDHHQSRSSTKKVLPS